MSVIFIVIASWQRYINTEFFFYLFFFFLHGIIKLFMKGFDQTHMFLLLGLVVVVPLLFPHQEDAA